ncbi:hypothetical protein [Mycolicibacterium sp. CBMA 295]|uniref:hypothetical protein n=1 Tax=Mycolicibacterium sp. CBMA 295 TaxID=2606605 RepID=UPI001391A36A|nr:hypothetical protein [Mycolicibacterium sp. CBMA 295]
MTVPAWLKTGVKTSMGLSIAALSCIAWDCIAGGGAVTGVTAMTLAPTKAMPAVTYGRRARFNAVSFDTDEGVSYH